MKFSFGGSWRWLFRKLRGHFLAGLLIVVPLSATILILIWIFNAIDGVLKPVIKLVFERSIPGVGFGVTVVLIYLIGAIASNVVGKGVFRYGEFLLSKVPVVRPIYTTIKQILESFSAPGRTGLMQAVLIEFPRKGIWTMGFITNESSALSGEAYLNIFIPTSPNPTTGFLQIVREDEVIRTDIPVDEALRMVISAGRVSPQGLSNSLAQRNE